MRRCLILASSLIAIATILAGLGWCLHYQKLFERYPEDSMTTFMGTERHRTLEKVHTEYDWYIKAAIEPGDGEKLMQRRAFQSGYNRLVLAGRVDEHRIEDCSACWFYYEGTGHGQYGYLLAVLSANERTLQLYEFFGD